MMLARFYFLDVENTMHCRNYRQHRSLYPLITFPTVWTCAIINIFECNMVVGINPFHGYRQSLHRKFTVKPCLFYCGISHVGFCCGISHVGSARREHFSEAFSLLFSVFAILDPNWMALLGNKADLIRPSFTAQALSRIFSPRPRG